MTPFHSFIILGLALLLNSAQLYAAAPDQPGQLRAEQKQLKSETQAMKEQILAEQVRVEQLKRKIEFFKLQNKVLDQRVLKEIQHYKGKRAVDADEDI